MGYTEDMQLFNERMTALATSIRTLGESSGAKTVVNMNTLVSGANTTIDGQSTLIGQIQSALAGKIAPSTITLQDKSVTYSASGTYYIVADTGYDGLNTVTVAIDSPEPTPPKTEEVVVTPTEEQQVITPSTGDYISKVTVNAISSDYVGSGITRQAATTITPSESVQTAVASGVYTTGAVTVAAIQIDTNNTFTAAGTYTPSSGKYFNSVTVDLGSMESELAAI